MTRTHHKTGSTERRRNRSPPGAFYNQNTQHIKLRSGHWSLAKARKQSKVSFARTISTRQQKHGQTLATTGHQDKRNEDDALDNLLVDRVKFRHQYDFVQRLMKRLEQTTPKILAIHKHDRGRL